MPDSIDGTCHTLDILHKKYIQGTITHALVRNETLFVCGLTRAVLTGCQLPSQKVYVNTRMLKHLYDKRPAVQYEFILKNLHKNIKYPDRVFKNKPGKRGGFLFAKQLGDVLLCCSLELVQSQENNEIFVTTAFFTDEDYLNKCILMWSWRDGTPSS